MGDSDGNPGLGSLDDNMLMQPKELRLLEGEELQEVIKELAPFLASNNMDNFDFQGFLDWCREKTNYFVDKKSELFNTIFKQINESSLFQIYKEILMNIIGHIIFPKGPKES